jgi:hypothetical protein
MTAKFMVINNKNLENLVNLLPTVFPPKVAES